MQGGTGGENLKVVEMEIKKFLKDLFTEADNKTFDLAKVLALLAVVNGLSLTVYEVAWKGTTFNFQDYGIGVGLLFGGLAAVLTFKKEANDKSES